jgi:hypothetical protein
MREVTITSDGWEAVWGDLLKAETVILNPCTDGGGEDKANKIEVTLYDGKVGEGGGRESHGEGASLYSGEFIFFLPIAGPLRGETPF